MSKEMLALADERRRERAWTFNEAKIDAFLDEIGLSEADCASIELSNADRVGPAARKKLKGILDKYAKSPHPFTDCVNDNTKRFGASGADKVCAVLKDIIKGTTKWRKGPKKVSMSLSECPLEQFDDDVIALLRNVNTEKLSELLAEEEHGTS